MLHQALFTRDDRGVRLDAQTGPFTGDWLALAERICEGFGPRPGGVPCPEAIFAAPFGPRHVAVGTATDAPGAGPGLPLRFRLLVLELPLYRAIGDPFAVAEQFPPDWSVSGDLPVRVWPDSPLPPRSLDRARQALQHGDSVALLGAAQALLDGGRVALVRLQPDPGWIRDLWSLLPDAARAGFWPASFAFGPGLEFHAVAIPPGVALPGRLTEEQCRDYPEGRYELALQVAVEDGDHRTFARLMNRQTTAQAFVTGVFVLLSVLGLLVAMRLIDRLMAGR
jgi:hypothetical protein